MRPWLRLRQSVALALLCAWLAACGAYPAASLKGTLRDDCAAQGRPASPPIVSLAPTQDGINFGLAQAGGEWQGKTAAARPGAGGVFIFSDIPPGRYGVFVLQMQVPEASGNPLIVEVTEGAAGELGTIHLASDGRGGCQALYIAP